MDLPKRAVIKIGSALIAESGQPRAAWLAALAEDCAAWRRAGTEIILVSSGAIALGRGALGAAMGGKRPRMEEKQAFAALGQPLLMHAWQAAFAAQSLHAAQVLLTLDDTEDRKRHVTCRAAIAAMLQLGAVPVINENDTVNTAEIRIGDNDRLAARVAQMMSADALLLLSDIDGLYTANPKLDSSAAFIPNVPHITPEIEAMAGDALPGVSTGGMRTKVMAAKIATTAGCRMAILRGTELHPLARMADGTQRCTWFEAATTPRAARKNWIAAHMAAKGAIVIDAGAAEALRQGKSLLPAGCLRAEGSFASGDVISITDAAGKVLGCGLAAYDYWEAARICGQQSEAVEVILGYPGPAAMIHRDDMVLRG